MSKQENTEDGRRVETAERKGIVVETTYDDKGKVASVVKWVKPEKRGDPRQAGPVENREQRPQ